MRRDLNRAVRGPLTRLTATCSYSVPCRFCAPWLLLAVLFAGCANSKKTHRLYEGEPRPQSEIARLTETINVQLISVNGRRVGSLTANPSWLQSEGAASIRAPVETFELLPGRHTIEVQTDYTFSEGEYSYRWTGINTWDIEADFEAGGYYKLIAQQPDGGKLKKERVAAGSVPVLFRQLAGVPDREIARPLLMPRPLTGDEYGEGTVIRGRAASAEKTATGEPVYLIADSRAARRWAKTIIQPRNKNLRPKPPMEHTVVRGYAAGYFDFVGVAPGRYLIVFPGTPKYPATASAVSIVEGQRQVVVVVEEPAAGLADYPAAPRTQPASDLLQVKAGVRSSGRRL